MNFSRIPLTSTLAKKAPRIGQGLYYDPLYGYIPVANELRQIIDSEVFQRIRGIKQLSTLYLVFAGAHHTRFEHSIGVSYLAGLVHERLVEHLSLEKENSKLKRVKLNKITLLAAQLAGLLHDIGHGPFAHVFEMFCRKNAAYEYWNHEKWGRSLITGDTSHFELNASQKEIFKQIPSLLKNLQSRLSTEFPDDPLLELLNPENIARICFDEPPEFDDPELSKTYYFLVDIVTSPYGVDRLDYLRRDAFYTGVQTGDIDIWEIIRNLGLHFHSGRVELMLHPNAGIGVEALIQARDSVYRKIYHNPVSRSAQELIIRGLISLKVKPEEIAFYGDNDLLDYFRSSDNKFAKEIEERIRFRILYELVPLCSFKDITTSIDTIHRLTDEHRFLEVENIIMRKLPLQEGQCVFYDIEKVPSVKEEDLTKKIFCSNNSHRPKSLAELFPHIQAQYFSGNEFSGSNKIESYKNYISKIYVSFPFDYIEKEVTDIVKRIDTNQTREIESAIESLYNAKLHNLVVYFFADMLGWSDNIFKHKVQVVNEAKQHFIDHLTEVVHVRQNLWIKD